MLKKRTCVECQRTWRHWRRAGPIRRFLYRLHIVGTAPPWCRREDGEAWHPHGPTTPEVLEIVNRMIREQRDLL